ncbi:MAG: hypothetical protein V2A61_07900 [Calditrichota bacterium]
MRFFLLLGIILLMAALSARADLSPGEKVPNPVLTAPDGSETSLHDMLKKVTVLHLWKCN